MEVYVRLAQRLVSSGSNGEFFFIAYYVLVRHPTPRNRHELGHLRLAESQARHRRQFQAASHPSDETCSEFL